MDLNLIDYPDILMIGIFHPTLKIWQYSIDIKLLPLRNNLFDFDYIDFIYHIDLVYYLSVNFQQEFNFRDIRKVLV